MAGCADTRTVRRIEEVSVSGTVGTARMTLAHGDDVFTDVFVLIRVDDARRSANTANHRSAAGPAQAS
ncbi:MAG: nuclear transport factor 2 family protein [Catenulispora sp.]